jgi:two-component system sensor histidine kinase RegB
MSDELLRHAGEPFYTTKEPGKGMGLGLFLVRLVAERFGGEFSIHSKLGEGTRCLLELPEAAEKNVKRSEHVREETDDQVAEKVPGGG